MRHRREHTGAHPGEVRPSISAVGDGRRWIGIDPGTGGSDEVGWFWNDGQRPDIRERIRWLRERPVWVQAVLLSLFIPVAVISQYWATTSTPGWPSSAASSTSGCASAGRGTRTDRTGPCTAPHPGGR